MSELAHSITYAQLRVAADLGHGGPSSEYKIVLDGDSHTVSLTISKPFPGPGEGALPPPPPPSPTPQPRPASGAPVYQPSYMTEVLVKDKQQVEEFLNKLITQFNVYELSDLAPPYPFLHPTFYSFSFRDSAGRSHSFDYRIECLTHLDERYRKLVEEFESFFESRRVFDKFYASQRDRTRASKPWWKLR